MSVMHLPPHPHISLLIGMDIEKESKPKLHMSHKWNNDAHSIVVFHKHLFFFLFCTYLIIFSPPLLLSFRCYINILTYIWYTTSCIVTLLVTHLLNELKREKEERGQKQVRWNAKILNEGEKKIGNDRRLGKAHKPGPIRKTLNNKKRKLMNW